MIRSVGIDLSRTGRHQARCLDEQARPCDSFTFDSTMEGLETLEKHVFSDGATPTIVFEPTGLAWIPLATYLRARHPDSRLVKARLQKVAALRKYLRGHAKSDRVDGVTLAKMPFIDAEQLEEAYLPPAEYHALQRLTRQRERLMKSITIRKNRIGAIVEGYLPGLRAAFTNEWSVHARAFYRSRLNPFAVVRDGKSRLCWTSWLGCMPGDLRLSPSDSTGLARHFPNSTNGRKLPAWSTRISSMTFRTRSPEN